ncbi:MAG: glycosyl transferase family protein [Parcubacteria group bacterium Gr01-1014_3]|nr:MAG: glycosyl transferase family protein [Parcubacteria group bacterium Gr01-1014_3]
MPSEFLRKYSLAILIIFALVFVLISLGSGPLIDSDEAHYAQVFHESWQRGDFLNFTRLGQSWFEKPPLYFWLMAGSVAIFGENEFAMRLPTALLAILAIYLTYLITLRLSNSKKAALLAAVILLTTGAFLDASRQVRMDVPVVASILFGIFSFLQARGNPKWFLGVGVGVATGVLFKSVIGFLAIPIILIFCALNKDWACVKNKYFWLSGIIAIVLILPWHIYQSVKFGFAFWNNYFGYHILNRFTEAILGNDPGVWFYFKNLFYQSEPWFLVLILLAVYMAIFDRKNITRSRPEVAIFLSAAFVFILFSLSKTKLVYYLVPIYPLASIFIAISLDRIKSRLGSPGFGLGVVGLSLIALVLTSVQIFFPIYFDKVIYPKGVISKYFLAEEERVIGKKITGEAMPVYAYAWPYRDTLVYYSGGREIWNFENDTKIQRPSFILIPAPIFKAFKIDKSEVIYHGSLGVLVRVY